MVICSGEIHFHWSSLQQTQHQVINFGFIQNTKYYTHEFHIYFLVVDIYIYIYIYVNTFFTTVGVLWTWHGCRKRFFVLLLASNLLPLF